MKSAKITQNNPRLLAVSFLMMAIGILLAIVMMTCSGCTSTVTKPVAKPAVASFDGNEQNSGVIARINQGYIVTAQWVARNRTLQGAYGQFVNPPLALDYGISAYTNGTYLATAEAVQDFGLMNLWKKNKLH